MEAKLGSSSKQLVIADASANVVAEGGGQMAFFLSASAPQGYKPLLFTMVATNLLCSIKQQLMRDEKHPGSSWGFIKRVRDFHSPSRGSMERARLLVPFLPLQIRNLPKNG